LKRDGGHSKRLKDLVEKELRERRSRPGDPQALPAVGPAQASAVGDGPVGDERGGRAPPGDEFGDARHQPNVAAAGNGVEDGRADHGRQDIEISASQRGNHRRARVHVDQLDIHALSGEQALLLSHVKRGVAQIRHRPHFERRHCRTLRAGGRFNAGHRHRDDSRRGR